jgi:hypothetical protein
MYAKESITNVYLLRWEIFAVHQFFAEKAPIGWECKDDNVSLSL